MATREVFRCDRCGREYDFTPYARMHSRRLFRHGEGPFGKHIADFREYDLCDECWEDFCSFIERRPVAGIGKVE